jgi:glycosyltransferase involved in cell wall biosynthesis
VGVHIQGELSYGLPHLKQMMNAADARVLVSNPCCQHWGLKKENTWMVWDAVRSVNDCCYEKVKQPYILFCSQWVTEGKGIRKTIIAYGMSNLFNSSNRIRLKIVGICDKEYEKELRAIADGYGCAEYVDFIHAQKDVKPFFSQAMAFINSSVNEGMGRTTAEAMFYGCPVIAYASGGT